MIAKKEKALVHAATESIRQSFKYDPALSDLEISKEQAARLVKHHENYLHNKEHILGPGVGELSEAYGQLEDATTDLIKALDHQVFKKTGIASSEFWKNSRERIKALNQFVQVMHDTLKSLPRKGGGPRPNPALDFYIHSMWSWYKGLTGRTRGKKEGPFLRLLTDCINVVDDSIGTVTPERVKRTLR